jgi:DNA recombination protein RmuC
VCRFADILIELRKGLTKADESFNQAVGSWQSRIVPGARKLKELGATLGGKELEDVEPVETALRELPSAGPSAT